MQKNTHLVFAFLLFLVCNFLLHLPLYMAVFVFIGAVIPDIDIKFRGLHRKLFHNIWFLILLLFGLFSLNLINSQVSTALIIGFCSHLIADSLTHMGIMPLWPIPRPRFNGPFVTGGKRELLLMIAMIFVIAYILGGMF